jgi:hypothetical protein
MTSPVLTHPTLGAIALPADLDWPDRYGHSPVVQTVATSLTGAAVVETWERVAWRAITLASGPDHGWVPTPTVEALAAAWAAGDVPMALALEGHTYAVLWDRSGGGFQAEPLKHRPLDARLSSDWWRVTLPLREVG